MIGKFRHKSTGGLPYVLVVVAIILARLAIALCQRVFLVPGSSALDDSLMFSAAESIVAGQWMGPYTAFSMAKSMGFPLWLAVVHQTGIPYLLANALLWLGVSGFTARALRPLAPGNLPRLFIFGFFALLPIGFAQFALRVYRDSIFSAFCLLFFAGVLGLALRVREDAPVGRWLSAVGVGLGLAGAFLLREDGVVLLPFAACALLLVVLAGFFSKEARKKWALLWQCLLPGAVLAVGIFAFSLTNHLYYGVFLVNDLNGGSFPGAYGAVAAVSQAESGFQRGAPVSNKALEKLIAEVPSLAALEPYFREGPVYNGFYNEELGAYGGSFYYALRLAAWYAGMTPDAQTAQRYWAMVQDEVRLAVAEGRLESVRLVNGTIPRWDGELIQPLAGETLSALRMTLFFEDIQPRPLPSEGDPQEVQRIAQWLNERVQPEAYEAGAETLYYNPVQKLVFLGCDVLIWVYRLIIWPLLALAFFQTIRNFARGARRLFSGKIFSFGLLGAMLSLGLLLSYLLRMGVASYMEVAAFGVGTYLLYLAGGVPTLALFCVFGGLQPTEPPFEKGVR